MKEISLTDFERMWLADQIRDVHSIGNKVFGKKLAHADNGDTTAEEVVYSVVPN